MKTPLRYLATACLFTQLTLPLMALPQEFGTFGQLAADTRDLTAPFLAAQSWDGSEPLAGEWTSKESLAGYRVACIRKAPILFGQRPIHVKASYLDDQLDHVSIYYLEAGAYFGYNPELKHTTDGVQLQRTKLSTFRKDYKRVEASLERAIKTLTNTRGQRASQGVTSMMRTSFRRYKEGDLAIQLHCEKDHFIRIDLRRYKDSLKNETYVNDKLVSSKKRDRLAAYKEKVQRNTDGDVNIKGVPMVPQGGRAYCGITTFLMAANYFGIQIDPPTMASRAGMKFGEGGNKMLEAYTAATREGNVRMTRGGKFDFKRAKKAIDQGYPVVVWRKYDTARNRLHTKGEALPEPDEKDQETWPDMETARNHASIITGYHDEKREVIFAESWGDNARDKRMRAEEMEGSAYMAFYFRL